MSQRARETSGYSTNFFLGKVHLSRFPLVLLPNLGLPLRELHLIVSMLACSYVTIDLDNACYCLSGSGYPFSINEVIYCCASADWRSCGRSVLLMLG